VTTSAATVNPLDLSGRHLLVTGASSGIGRATAVLASRLGARVTLTARDPARLEATLSQLQPGDHATAAFDLSAIDAIPKWLRGIAETRGSFGGLAHCAGIQVSKPVRALDAAFMASTFEVNVASGLSLARGLRQRGCCSPGASMVLVSSASAFVGQAANVVYCASKGAVVAATRALAVELMRDGIRVNCVCPALVDTEMAAKFRTVMSESQFEEYTKQYPLGIGRPEDIAGAIVFFLAETGRWMTGTSLLVDGGALAGG
jgi:NAD(P)-dependent dehydrogenase (short-subunit alcohol dehydrogenase family)